MKKILLLFVFVLSIAQTFAQRNNAWQILPSDKIITSEKVRPTEYSEKQQLLQFNNQQFKDLLTNIADVRSGQAGIEIIFPTINGTIERYLVWESSNFEPSLQTKFPEIRAFVGKGITDPTARLNFSFSPLGIQTMIIRADEGAEFIETYTKDQSVYVLFDSKTRFKGDNYFVCSTKDIALAQELTNGTNVAHKSSAQVYKTMRLALSCTAEYTSYFGGTVPLAIAGMNATMARVNGVMEKDLAVKLIMIDNTAVVFTNASTDPYSSVTIVGGQASAPAAWNQQLQTTLTNTIGDGNYDIGHLFGASGGGGNAGCIGCVCVSPTTGVPLGKGSGITSPGSGAPTGDTFDIDYVAHEMGHQLGGNHTFTFTTEDNSVNVEPGSGSTIMAYAGVADTTPVDLNIQAHSDPYYTYKSIAQIQSNLTNKSCPISYNASSTPAYTNLKPVLTSIPSVTIPISTAFKLTGNGTGEAGETLTYCWEQNNDATSAGVGTTACLPSLTKTDGPNFRSFNPSASPIRYMPALATVLSNNLTTKWETVSSVARSLSFALTVRDNVLAGGQTNSVAQSVTVSAAAGPFKVTSQNTANINWAQASTQTITWDVANTTASPINTANVNIKLSTDGGLNFDTILAANTPNDGTEDITVPAISALNCRILVEAVGNIFYAVNTKVFSVGASCNVFSATPNVAIADGTGTNVAGATTTSVINVPNNINISNMKVNLKITHPKIGDLVIKLTGPDATVRTLWNRNCNAATYANMDLTFADGTGTITCASPASGTYQSFQTLAGYNNKSSLGNWTLTVTDNNLNNVGTLVSWGVDFGCTLANNQYQISDLAIYPNPNKGSFNVKFDNPSSSEIKVDVYDISGRKIFENNYSTQANFNENIQLSNAASGVYLVSVVDGERKIVKRIIIE